MDIARILQKIRPNAVWSLNENKFEKLSWKDESPKPSYQEVVDAWEEIEQELENERIKNLRKRAYQEESDPLFFEYQRGDIEKSEWIAKVQEIKERFPLTASSQT
jgi:hypothetical protein